MVGEQGLVELFKRAHSMFRELGVGTNCSWSRFVEAYLCEYAHHDATDAYSKKSHDSNLQIMRGLLERELDLILPFLLDDAIDEKAIRAIVRDYNKRGISLESIVRQYVKSTPPDKEETPPLNAEHESSAPIPVRSVRHCIDRHGINLIARYANEVELFSEMVCGDDILEILEARTRHPFHVKDNTLLGILIDHLEAKLVMKRGWKKLMEQREILYSASSTPEKPRFLTAHDLYQSVRSQNNYRIEFERMSEYLADITNLIDK